MYGPWFTEVLAAEHVADLHRDAAGRVARPRRPRRPAVPALRRHGWLRTPAVAGCGA